MRRLNNNSNSSSTKSKRSLLSIQTFLTHAVFGLICCYVGLLVGMSTSPSITDTTSSSGSGSSGGGRSSESAAVVKCPSCPTVSNPACPKQEMARPAVSASSTSTSTSRNIQTFPATLDNMVVDFATIPRNEFNDLLEVGVPFDDTKAGSEDVLLLYTSERSLPDDTSHMVGMTAKEATQNCQTVKVVLQDPSSRGKSPQCFAIVPQWESYYVHKFMRLGTKEGAALDPKVPLRYVSRSHADKGTHSHVPDLTQHTTPFYPVLVDYLQHLKRILLELKPILTAMMQASTHPASNSIIVQVCNYGQAELWHSFICSARARGLDTSHILMFATDEATLALCRQLGIPAYYDEAIFGSLPESAARAYGDRTFSKMMMAKVYCVHLVLSSGYNVLFQDVDVVWYKDPLPYFSSPAAQEWDMMFQDDGARSIRYAPYSPNTGFYFVRCNPDTQYFFGMLLRHGDLIARTSSHQAALTTLLNDHVSWRGLRVKVWKKGPTNAFPGGVEYHRAKDQMKKMLAGNATTDPYIFHMSWTTNKANKKLYFQQMGEWYLKDDCMTGGACCLAEPHIVCHYRDKPSIIPCRDAPPIDKGRPSFW